MEDEKQNKGATLLWRGNKLPCEDCKVIFKNKFGKEFEKQRIARKILERIDNKTIDKLFDTITPEIVTEISDKDNFDFHAVSIVKLLGIRKSLSTAQNIMGGEIKHLLTGKSHPTASKV